MSISLKMLKETSKSKSIKWESLHKYYSLEKDRVIARKDKESRKFH
jgi:hypothetical protein